MGHTVMENRNGLIVKAAASHATGKAEREVAADLLAELPGMKKRTVGADKNYDTAGFVADCRAMNVTPHVARNDNRAGGSAIDGRTSRHSSYKVSQRSRKRVEEPFGWGKSVGLIRQMKVRGLSKVNSVFMMNDDRLEPDTNEGATGVVRLDGGEPLRSPPICLKTTENHRFKPKNLASNDRCVRSWVKINSLLGAISADAQVWNDLVVLSVGCYQCRTSLHGRGRDQGVCHSEPM